MGISAVLEGSTRAHEADWVELTVLVTKEVVGPSAFLRSTAAQDEPSHGLEFGELDGVPVEKEVLESAQDYASQRVFEELVFRAEVLGVAYPFRLDRKYGSWRLLRRHATSSAENAAHQAYIASLITSAIHSEVWPMKHTDLLFRDSAKVMQALSYLAAGELVGGRAYWFGWPRPEGTNMLTAIQDLVVKMGIGEAPTERPADVSPNANDGTIDIVAWRPFQDQRYGGIVAYGQVASGRNWPTKPVHTFIEEEFFEWFVRPPAKSKYLEAIFIPFLQHQDQAELSRDSATASFLDKARGKSRTRSLTFGIVVDRLRLTELVFHAVANKRCEEADLTTHGVAVLRWVAQAKARARREAI